MPQIIENTTELWRHCFPVPRPDGHKYLRGHTVVLSGGSARTGAARLAAQAALRVGSGLVTLFSPPGAMLVNAAHLTAVMLKSVKGMEELSIALQENRITSVVLGPALGVGEKTRQKVETVLAGSKATVLDADALTSFADKRERLFEVIRNSSAPVVLTPHMGEFCSLFGGRATNDPDERSKRVVEAAKTCGAIVVLKGAGTLVADPSSSRVSHDHNAPPWLATAGSGDVLAGTIGGLLAQGMPGFDAASAGVWLHGEAGNICGPGLTAEDLDEGLREAAGVVLEALISEVDYPKMI